MDVLTLILGGGRGGRLSVLTEQRAKPALPFGGKYRVIDFTLANLVHAGLSPVAVIAQFEAQSLMNHLGQGEPWGLDRHGPGGLQVWLPGLSRTGREQYTGTADAVYQNRKFIEDMGCETVLIVSGDFLYRQDYRDLLAFHQAKGAAFTLSAMPVAPQEAHRFGMLSLDADGKVTAFDEKTTQPVDHPLASMGIYVFQTAYLLQKLEEDARQPASRHDFGRDVIPGIVAEGQAYGYRYAGYWAEIGSVEEYWSANLALLSQTPPIDLHHPDWAIATRSVPRPPAAIIPLGQVNNCLVSEGCLIEGEVSHSVLSPGVRVEQGAVVRDSVVLSDTIIRAGAVVDRCVLDEEVEIGADAQVGSGGDTPPNADEPAILSAGITVVGRQAQVPPAAEIGRNCRIDSGVTPHDFDGLTIPSGRTVHH
jgi:glucose-1-phosphate adenylyltransferase